MTARVTAMAFLAVLAGCGPEDEPVDTATACEGGGDPTITLGTGSSSDFVAFEDGDVVALSNGGVALAILTTGLDTREPVTAVLKVAIDGENADAVASLALQCPSDGPGWIQVVAPLPAALQDADPATLSGMTLTLDAVATDARDVTASADPVGLVVE